MNNKKWSITRMMLGILATSSLAGCVGLDVVYLAGTVTSQNINIVARAETDIKTQDGVKVYPIAMKQQISVFTDPCHYRGVLVEYARDWPEMQESTGTVLPPAPDKPIGYALILTQEKCPGKDARAIFSLDEKHFYLIGLGNYVVREGFRMDAVDYSGYPEDKRPKWLPQVLKTIHAEAGRNAAARDFEADMASRHGDAKTRTQ